MIDIEHPDITAAEATGYPVGGMPKVVYCDRCGDEILVGDSYWDEDYDYLCEDCLLHLHRRDAY